MKMILIALTALTSLSAFAAPAATYQCGAKQVTLTQSADSYVVAVSYVATNLATKVQHTVHIVSEPIRLQDASATFTAEQSMAGQALKSLTALPLDSAAFAGFHYPSGEMYVTAEGDTNEEGYFFAASPELLKGEASGSAAEIFWSYFDAPKVAGGNCTRLQ